MAKDSHGIDLAVQRYRVMHREAIIGQFSNRKLAEQLARSRAGAVVLDMSVNPPKLVYSDGKWLEK